MTISAETFDVHKKFLWGICYRMTGSASDAEDIVQDTFVRALEKPPADLDAPLRPWLVKVALNLSRDQLRRRRRREYFGPWLPAPVITEGDSPLELDQRMTSGISPMARYDLIESVTVAFLLALEVLTPAQRAVLLLRDVFEYSTSETGEVLEMSEANVKVTLHRARRSMDAYDKDRVTTLSKTGEKMRETLQTFLSRLASGDIEGLKQLLAADVVLVSDGGGEINALAEPLQGRAKVLRLLSKLYDAYRDVTRTSLGVLNGESAILIERSKVKAGHASFFTMHGQLDQNSNLRRLHFVFSPSKLSAVRPAN